MAFGQVEPWQGRGTGCYRHFGARILVLKQRIDTERFRATSAQLVEGFIVAQGGIVVVSKETESNTFATDSREEGADTACQLVQYRLGPYRGSVSMRITVFGHAREAGHVYLVQSSLK